MRSRIAELAGPESLRLGVGEVTRLGIKVAVVQPRKAPPRRLVLSGSLALRPEGVARVRARCTPAVVLGVEVKVGEWVKKGQVLAVLNSDDVGGKKIDLLDALLQLAQEKEILDRTEKARDSVPEVVLLKARRNVLAARNAVNRARNNLLVRGLSEADLGPVEKEAKRIIAARYKRDPDKDKSTLEKWGRVEIRAPMAGLIVERSVVVGEMLADGTTNLFQIADRSKLNVIASVRGEDLPQLLALSRRYVPRPIPWQVRLVSDKERPPLKSEGLRSIGYLIDPYQHTTTAVGQVENPDGTLRAGQMVSATISLPAAPREVIVPTSALVEAGGSTFVFVQGDPNKAVFTRRSVTVVRRGRDVAHVRVQSGAGKAGRSLRVGDRVVIQGAVDLQSTLDDLRDEDP
jgi:cobalt-zinc-cadmium efflux system membrane fusion protein